MQTWDDLLAAVRAGAPPQETLPQIRELLHSHPPAPQATQNEPSESTTPTSRLYRTLKPGSDKFQIPYLRPPSSTVHALRARHDAEAGKQDLFYDTEMDVDVLAMFGPRYMSPPGREVRKMVDEFCGATKKRPRGRYGATEMDCGAVETEEHALGLAEVSRVSRLLQDYLEDPSSTPPSFPPLSLTEWSLVFSTFHSEGAHDNLLLPDVVETLLQSVNQASLGRFALCTILPLLVDDMEMDSFIRLVDIAVARGAVQSASAKEIRALTRIYLGLGVSGAVAQLRIVCRGTI